MTYAKLPSVETLRELFHYEPTGSTVVLTVAHLDHTPENCDPANLKDSCQRCHNRYNQPRRNAEATRRRKLACGDLLEGAAA